MSYIDKLVNNWPLSSDTLDLLMSAEQMLRQARADEISWSRSWACVAVVEFCALKHFGFDTSNESFVQLFDESIRLGVDFFYGDWWHSENVVRWCDERAATDGNICRRSEVLRAALLSEPKKLEPWRDTLSALMFLCTIAGQQQQRTQICDWFGPDPLPEYSGLYWETEATTIVLASHLRSKPMEGVETLIAKIAKCKRPYALVRLKLIQACFARDQSAFSELLPIALDRFYKSFTSKEPCIASDLVAIDESTIVAIATSFGLELPRLTEKQSWALMTRESISF